VRPRLRSHWLYAGFLIWGFKKAPQTAHFLEGEPVHASPLRGESWLTLLATAGTDGLLRINCRGASRQRETRLSGIWSPTRALNALLWSMRAPPEPLSPCGAQLSIPESRPWAG